MARLQPGKSKQYALIFSFPAAQKRVQASVLTVFGSLRPWATTLLTLLSKSVQMNWFGHISVPPVAFCLPSERKPELVSDQVPQ